MYFPTTHYVGFARRAAAAILDSLLFMVIEAPFMVLAYGWEYYDFSEGAPFVHGSLYVLFTWILPEARTVVIRTDLVSSISQ